MPEPMRDKTPRQMVEMFKDHLGQWDYETYGKPSYQGMACYLNARGATTARGMQWSGQTLFVAAQRYHVDLLSMLPERPVAMLDTNDTAAVNAANRDRAQWNQDIIRAEFINWAKGWTLKIVPSAGVVARDLNKAESRTTSGRLWQSATVLNALSTLGYGYGGQQVGVLLEATGWVGGIGRTAADIEEWEREKRREAMRPRYEKIVVEGLDCRVPETLRLQVQLVGIFEGLGPEDTVLKYSVIPWEVAEALALRGD